MSAPEYLPQDDRIDVVSSNKTAGVDYSEYSATHPTLETILQEFVPGEAYIAGFDGEEEILLATPSPKFGKILVKLSAMEVPAKEQIEEYLRDQYRRQCTTQTIRHSLASICDFMGFVGKADKEHLEQISRDDLTAWIEYDQDRGIKPSTVNLKLSTVKAFLRFFEAKQMVSPAVLATRLSVKVPDALPRAMDAQDVRRLLSVIDTLRDRAMITVLVRTGMRIGELLQTIVREVSLTERRIEIFEARKTRVGRVVYLSDDALETLTAWFAKRDPRKRHLFYARGHDTLTYAAARMVFVKYLNKAGLLHKGYSLHCLRHTFATELLNAGMSLPCLQQLLGHSSIQMTLRYARLSDKTREEEYFKAMSRIEKEHCDEHN